MFLLGLEIALLLVVAFLAGAVLLTLSLGRRRAGGIGGGVAPVVVLGALAVLAIFCVPRRGIAIQQALQASASARLAAVGVRADGRELVLTGPVPSPEARAEAGALALALPGVRTVSNELEVMPPAPAAPPPSPAALVQARLGSILTARKVEFRPSSAVLAPESLPVLEEVRAVLASAPDLSVSIEGHTDGRGDPAANRALSQARAAAVAAWLAAEGIDRARLDARGYGADRPLTGDDTPAGRARNRRVEILAR